MLTSALFAGFAAGLIAAFLHFAFVQNYILLGEEYETGAAVHFQGVAHGNAGHSHDAAEPAAAQIAPAAEPAAPAEADGHSADGHTHEGEEPSTLERNGLTVLFTALTYTAFSLLLIVGFALAEMYGKVITAREGVLWGLAGYVALIMAPAMGLAPELPGTQAAELVSRQIWWLGTVVATAIALGLIAYGRGPLALVAAVVIAAIPHVIGAPELEGFSGVAPPEVSGAFSARVLGIGLVSWVALGWLAGWFWSRNRA